MKLLRLLKFGMASIKALRQFEKNMSKLGSCWVVVYPGSLGKKYDISDPVLTESVAYDSARYLCQALYNAAKKYNLLNGGSEK